MWKLAHLNVEGSRHTDRVVQFLRRQNPDVVCFEECSRSDVPLYEEVLGAQSFFVPMLRSGDMIKGICIFSRYPMRNQYAERYGGSTEELPEFDGTNPETIHASARFSLMTCDIDTEEGTYRIGTTHFPVTNKGEATDFQRADMKALLGLLEERGALVFTGDFNAPRGGEMFSTLAERYTDNVPPHYKTSIDLHLHREAKDHADELATKMVDGIFSTPEYTVQDVTMHCGVSDHCALVASVMKNGRI